VLDETWLPAAGVVTIMSMSRAIMFFGALLEPTLITTGRGRQQFTIRMWGAGSLLVLLLVFARYGAEAAAWAHLASALLVAATALTGMTRAMEMPLRQLAGAFLPALALTALTVVVIAATALPRAALGPLPGLLFCLAAVAAAWMALMALFLRRKVLSLPTP
jgi:O-antigen/teichoic acid export membrane protein